jgi:hypothetical protein
VWIAADNWREALELREEKNYPKAAKLFTPANLTAGNSLKLRHLDWK